MDRLSGSKPEEACQSESSAAASCRKQIFSIPNEIVRTISKQEKFNCQLSILEAARAEAEVTRSLSNDWKSRRCQAKSRNEVRKLSGLFYLIANILIYLLINTCCLTVNNAQEISSKLPDLISATSDEPIVTVVGQDAFISCVAKNLQNYTIIWRYTSDTNAPASTDNSGDQSDSLEADSKLGTIISAGRQRVVADDRFSVIQSHDTWLLKISQTKLSDTGTYICQANSRPKVRVLRILSVIKASSNSSSAGGGETETGEFYISQLTQKSI